VIERSNNTNTPTKFVGVKFKGAGKIYHFLPRELKIKRGDNVIVETSHGLEFGNVVSMGEQNFNYSSRPMKNIVRIATANDEEIYNKNLNREREMMEIFSKKIVEYKLDMRATSCDIAFDGSKIMFYFTAETRIDFRELVKDLAGIFRARIELRQIGVRDEAKLLGGLGICGRNFCCASFLNDFHPVSIKMAKEQSLSLNPTKISGTCGRLMCCLKYEQDCYEELIKETPRVGALVDTPEGRGVVQDANLLTGMLRVKLFNKDKETQRENQNDSSAKNTHESKETRETDNTPPISINKSEVKVVERGTNRSAKPAKPSPKAPAKSGKPSKTQKPPRIKSNNPNNSNNYNNQVSPVKSDALQAKQTGQTGRQASQQHQKLQPPRTKQSPKPHHSKANQNGMNNQNKSSLPPPNNVGKSKRVVRTSKPSTPPLQSNKPNLPPTQKS